MKSEKFALILLILALSIQACVPAKREKAGPIDTAFYPDFDQIAHQVLYSFQDKLQSDSLYAYFDHSNEELRYLAVLAFGSIKDKEALSRIVPMLKDPSLAVRIAAAYAIGQIGDVKGERALSEAFVNFDTVPGFEHLNAAILEAIGKCGSAASLKLIAETSTYLPTDTTLLLGQMRAIFRYGQRNIFHEIATQTAVKLLTKALIPLEVRQLAGIYLLRFGPPNLHTHLEELRSALETEQDTGLLMYLQPLLIRHGGEEGIALLERLLKQTNVDYRTKINALRQVENLPPSRLFPLMSDLLKNGEPLYAEAAAMYFLDHGNQDQSDWYFKIIDSIPETSKEAKLVMAAASGRHASPYVRAAHAKVAAYLSKELKEKEYSPVIKRQVVLAMGHCLDCLVPLKNILTDEGEDITLRSAAAESLGTLAAAPNFSLFYKSASTEVKVFIAKYLSLAILTPEEGLIASAAGAITNPTAGLRLFVSDTINWERIRQSLKLPAQAEDYMSLLTLEDFLENKTNKESWSPPYNHPLDWDHLRKITDTTRAVIKTTKGNISIQLYKKRAPGTVLTFVQLATSQFYDGKIFHRVVPNFVIQGGCTRGDGYGSLDFSLRSELGYSYFDDEGYIGMASAGNHTESQQFFITHSPTPHLDGNYTLFGKVMEGMDVVHQISKGDVIESIIILY